MIRRVLLVFNLLLLCLAKSSSAQIVINELVPANNTVNVSGSSSFDDWIEIFNDGNSSVNLAGYGLSDDPSKPYAFTFPNFNLDDDHYVVVMASDTNITVLTDHWETAVTAGTTWKYFIGVSQPDTNWRNLNFNDGSWPSGNGGIGFGDGDDATTITTSARSVMMRKTFTIPDTSEILKGILHMDYDDGFVAYLNGVEIARANLGVPGDRPSYTVFANSSHEAIMYQGQDPDSFFIDTKLLKSILIQGTNVLAVQVHNQSTSSNDLTSKPYLSFGIRSSGMIFNSVPSWFNQPDEELFAAKFKLSRTGETIYLTNPSGTVVDQYTYTEMQADNSMARIPDGSNTWCLVGSPTPKSSNNSSTCYVGYANKPVLSIPAGFYASSQSVTLINSTPGGVIRYTTNGDIPTTSSPIYTSPISLTNSKTIRARVFANNYLPSDVVTNTYVINETVTLPVFSITTDSLNLWDYNTGIYVLGPNAETNYPYKNANFWQNWSKPASIEYFDRSKNRLLSFDAAIKIYGNYSRAKPQKSLEIVLKDKYGLGSVDFAFISDKPQIDKTNNILLRNSGTDWNVTHFRDAFMQRVLKRTHTGYLATEPAVMYLNGQYWGVFQINENHDHHWIENNYGLDDDEFDYMVESGSTITVKDGSSDTYWNAYNYATSQNPNSTQYYDDMGQFWDLDNYKDYFIGETYYNNGDWIGDWTNNIKLWRPKAAGGKLRYLVYDLDFGCGYSGTYTDNRLAQAIDPAANSYSSNMFDAMLDNPRFKTEFINRYADLINTIFLPSEMLPILHQFQDSMAYDMPDHFNKWGSTMTGWQSRIDVVTNFINNRPAYARDHIQSQFNLTKQVSLTFNVSPAGAGRIEVSTVIPESYPWTGVYFDGNPVTIRAIPNPGYTFDHWNSNHGINDINQITTYNFTNSSESITANFTGSAQAATLVVSEFNYNSDSALNAHDWIEIHNFGAMPIDLTGWHIKDQNDYDSYVFPVGTTIPAGGYLVVAEDLSKFQSVYPSVSNVIGPLGFHLSNSGDQIRLFDPSEQLFLSLFYFDTAPWPASADGEGYTCELVSNASNPNDPTSWFAGCIGGSPGRAYNTTLSTPTFISGNSNFCSGGQTILSVNYTPGYSYQWRRNGIDIGGAIDTTFSATAAGNYNVQVINAGCSAFSDTLIVSTVTSSSPPVVNDGSRCGGGTVTLTASAPDSIYWFDAPGGNIIGTGPSFTTPAIGTNTTYYAQVSLSCPSTPVPVNAIINAITQVPVAADVSRCGPGAVVIDASDTAAIFWYAEPVGGALLHSGTQFITGYIPHDTTFYLQAGTYCPSERIPVNVTITSSPSPVVSEMTRCGPGTLVLTASSFAPVFWYDSIVAGNQVGSGVNFLTPVLTESKTYYAESNNGCASARVPALATVYEVPAAPMAADSSICGDGEVHLFATSSAQIFWYDTPTGGTSIGSGSSFMTPPITSTTTYYAESFDICSSTRTAVNAVIEPLPAQPVGSNVSLCDSGSALLSATASDPIFWFDQLTGGSVLGTGNSFMTPVLNSTTTYYAVAIANCSSVATPVTATVTTLPQGFLGNDITINSGNSATLDAGAGFDSYSWSTLETSQSISVSAAGEYIVEVSLNGCITTDTVVVTLITGTGQATAADKLKFYPNPVSDRLTLEIPMDAPKWTSITLLDLAGKEILRQEDYLLPGNNIILLNMEQFAKGMYMLAIGSDNFTRTFLITVK